MSISTVVSNGGAAASAPSVSTLSASADISEFSLENARPVVSGNSVATESFVPAQELSDFLTRYVQISTFAAPTSGAAATIFQTLDPWALYLANTSVAAKLRDFALLRSDLEILVVSAFPPGAFGRFEVCAEPVGGDPAFGVTPGGSPAFYTTSVGPSCRAFDIHATVDAGAADELEITLPWFWPYDYFELPGGTPETYTSREQWLLRFVTLAGVATAVPGGVASGNFTVFARLAKGYQLCTPMAQGPKKVQDFEQKGKPSAIARSVANAADALSDVPLIGGVATAVHSVADAVSRAAAFFGFSREFHEPVSEAFWSTPWSNVATTDRPVVGMNAQLVPGLGLPENPALAGEGARDVASFDSLFSRWSFLEAIDWPTAAANGAHLTSIPVAPGYMGGSREHLSIPGYVGIPFAKWRGDMEYMVEVVCAPLHRGTLQVAWVPFGTGWVSGDPTNKAFNHVFPIDPSKKHVYRIPYSRMCPFLNNEYFQEGTTIPGSDHCNGYLFIRVINPLQVQVASQTVRILVWVRGTESLDFRSPRQALTVHEDPGSGSYPLEGIRFQGPALGDDGSPGEVVHTFGTTALYPSDAATFPGQGVRSVRALLQKPSRQLFTQGALPFIADGSFALSSLGNDQGDDDADVYPFFKDMWTWQLHYRQLFASVATSMRTFLRGSSQAALGAYAGYANVSGTDQLHIGSTTMPVVWNPEDGATFSVPWSRCETFLNGGTRLSFAGAGVNFIRYPLPHIFFGPTTDAAVTQAVFYYSYGDDVRVGRFRGVPRPRWADFGTFAEINANNPRFTDAATAPP